LIQLNRSGEKEEKMMRPLMFGGILAASASAANAQDTSGNPEAGRVFARQVCSPCHAVTVVQASQRVMAIGPDFQTIANNTRNDDDRSSRLFADAASQDAEPDSEPGTISRCDRLRA